MVQAAVEGVVDFSQVRFFDPPSQLKTRLLLRGLDRKNTRQFYELLHHHHLATLSIPLATPEMVESTIKQTHKLLRKLTFSYHPWREEEDDAQLEKRETQVLIEGWEQRFGKRTDPRTKAKIDNFVEAMQARREAAQQEQSAIGKALAQKELHKHGSRHVRPTR